MENNKEDVLKRAFKKDTEERLTPVFNKYITFIAPVDNRVEKNTI